MQHGRLPASPQGKRPTRKHWLQTDTKLPSAPPAPLLHASPQSHSLGPGPAEAGGLPHPSPRGALPLFSLSLPTVSFPPVTNCRSYKHVLPLPPLSLPASNFCQIYLGNVPTDRTSQSDENRSWK